MNLVRQALLLVVVLALPAVAAQLGPLTYDLHPPIRIEGDAMFAPGGVPNLLAGVRSGAGSSDDPFRIGRWYVAPGSATAWLGGNAFGCNFDGAGVPSVHLLGTKAHVRLDSNHVEGTEPMFLARESCPYWLWTSYAGVVIERAENVVIDGLYVENFVRGITILHSRNITLRHVNLTDDMLATWAGVTIMNSTVSIEHSIIDRTFFGLNLIDSTVSVRDSSLLDNLYADMMLIRGNIVDARGNWWGDVSGPGYREWCCGQIFLYEPWLHAPPRDAGYRSEFLPLP